MAKITRKETLLSKIMLLLIKFYRIITAPLPHVCRFEPTCSVYTYQAIKKYGAIKGGYLGIKRILKCHPYHKGGYDPVP